MQFGVVLPLPDTCTSSPGNHPGGIPAPVLDWNPITSAGAASAFAAVLAGFVFAGIVVTLGQPHPDAARQVHADRALKLLLAAFFTLAVDAYLYAISGGEQVCLRGDTEQAMNGGGLALGAILILLALGWLVVAYKRDASIAFARHMTEFAMYFIILMLVTASTGYLNAALPKTEHPMGNGLMWGFGALSAGLVACMFRMGHLRALDSTHVVALDKRVHQAAWAGLAFAGSSATVSGIAMSIGASHWYPEAPWLLVYLIAWFALVAPVMVEFVAIRAVVRQ